jgi:hypothetical protein
MNEMALKHDAERTRAFGRELVDTCLDPMCDIGRRRGEIDNDLRSPLADHHAFPLRIGDRRRRALAHGIEGYKLCLFVRFERILILQCFDHRGVDGVAILDLRSQGSRQDALLRALGGKQDGLAERELVLGERPGLVRAQNVDACHLLNGRQLGNNCFLLGRR